MTFLLYPPIAFLAYLLLVGLISLAGRSLAAKAGPHSPYKTDTYSSGEAHPVSAAAPGYRQFFNVGLFFAALHLGILMAGSGGLTLVTGIYLVGLVLVLLALILG
jgi:NADH:ubiquinone oxidoreductase subunit 3 (subunit A)